MHYLGYEYGFPSTFRGQWKLIFGGQLNLTSLVFFGSILVALVLSRGPQRKFLIGWLVFLFLVPLNPVFMPLISKQLTTLTAYWRLFFILPFPLVIGIAVARLATVCRCESRRKALVAGSLLLAMALVFNLVDSRRDFKDRIAVFSKISYGLFSHKLPAQTEREVKQIIAASVPGVMISPMRYSALIPLFTNDIPQVSVREFFLLYASVNNSQKEEALSKIAAIRYISGISSKGFIDLESLLVKPPLKDIVLDAKVSNNHVILDALGRHGFKKAREGRSYVLYTRRKPASFRP